MHTSECQGGSFAPNGTYSPPFNDIWSLGIILLNLITGRNPWKSASSSDPTFQAYLQSPANFLPSVLPISAEVNEILLRTLDIGWLNRISITELRRAIKGVRTFYANDVVFEGSKARCSWEAGINIAGGSQPEDDGFDFPPHEEQQQEPGELYEGSIIMRSADSTTMHTALESPVAYSSFFLQSSVSVAKPSYAAPSAFEVGISTYDEDDERLRDSMSWTRASTYDQRTRAEEDLVNVSPIDFSPTEQEYTAMHATISHSPVSGISWPDFYGVMPLRPPPPQTQGPRMGLPFPLVPLKSSPSPPPPPPPPPQAQGPRMRLPFRLLPLKSSPTTITRTKDVLSIPVRGVLEEPNANSDIDSICGDRYDLFSRSRPQI